MRKTVLILAVTILFLAGHAVFAEDNVNANGKQDKDAAGAKKKELSNPEKIERIKKNIKVFSEILNLVPGLTKDVDDAGNVEIKYEGTRLEGLSKEKLDNLYYRVGRESVRLRTDRINRQLELIRRTEALNRQQDSIRQAEQANRQARQNYLPPSAPKAPPQTKR